MRRSKLARKRSKDDSQLQLFTDPGEEVVRMLQFIDTDQVTPLDALKKLKELQDGLQR